MAAVAQRTAQLAFIYKGSKRSDRLLLQAADLAAELGKDLTVVRPFVIPADGPGCCGLRGRRWREMLLEVAEEDAQRARQLLAGTDVPYSVAVVEGAAVPEIVAGFVAEGERELALPRSPVGTGLTRSDLRRVRRRTTHRSLDYALVAAERSAN